LQLRDLTPYSVISAIMGAVVFLLNWLPITNQSLLLALQLLVGALVYMILCRVFRLPIFMEAWHVFFTKVRKFRAARV
jgi:hypothetical protein